MRNSANLKPGWRIVRFGDVVHQIKDRIDWESSGLTEYVRGEHFEPGNLRLIGRSQLGDGQHGPAFHMRFRKGDVLYVSRNPQLRKAAVADFDGICANTTYVLRADGENLLHELLPFIMQTETFVEYTIRHKRGSTNFYLNWSDIAPYEFALPPLEEQRRIANLLQALTYAQDRYEDAIYSSRLVVESMLNHQIDSVVSDKTMTEINIEDLGYEDEQVLKTGPFGSKLKTSYFRDSGIPIISIGSLQENGLNEDEFFYLDPMYEQEFQDYKTEYGDIVFSRVADVGRCHLITESDAGFIISSNLVRIRVNPSIIRPSYLWLLLKYSIGMRRQIARITTQAAGRLLVNTKTMQKLNFSVPALYQQDSVISKFNEAEAAKSLFIRRACINKEFLQRSLEISFSGLKDV